MFIEKNDDFLTQLTLLYQKCRKTRSVTVTVKRYDGRTKPQPRPSTQSTSKKPQQQTQQQAKGVKKPEHPVEPQCLIRACDGGKNKLSTVVYAKDLNKFQRAYTSVLRSNIDGLKKHNKKKNKSSATTTAPTAAGDQ